MSTTIRQVCDGWDVRAMAASGESVTLHFRAEPSEAQVADALASYEAMQVAAPTALDVPAGGPAAETPTVTVEAEDGTQV